MFITHLVFFLLIGLAAGWLAGYLSRGNGFGLLGNLIVGVAGSLIGGLILKVIPEMVRELVLATAGALLFLNALAYIVPALKRKQKASKPKPKFKKR